MSEQERLRVVASNIEGFWGELLKRKMGADWDETFARILADDVRALREVADKL